MSFCIKDLRIIGIFYFSGSRSVLIATKGWWYCPMCSKVLLIAFFSSQLLFHVCSWLFDASSPILLVPLLSFRGIFPKKSVLQLCMSLSFSQKSKHSHVLTSNHSDLPTFTPGCPVRIDVLCCAVSIHVCSVHLLRLITHTLACASFPISCKPCSTFRSRCLPLFLSSRYGTFLFLYLFYFIQHNLQPFCTKWQTFTLP